MTNYIRKLFYRLMAHHYESQARKAAFFEDEAEYKKAKSNGDVWLKRLREMGL